MPIIFRASFLIIVLISITGINAQTVSPDYQDGIIYFKVNYEKGVEFKVNEDLSVNPTEFPTLKEIFKKYGVISPLLLEEVLPELPLVFPELALFSVFFVSLLF